MLLRQDKIYVHVFSILWLLLNIKRYRNIIFFSIKENEFKSIVYVEIQFLIQYIYILLCFSIKFCDL